MKIKVLNVMVSAAVLLGFAMGGLCALPSPDVPTANLTEKWPTNGNNWGLKNGLNPAGAPVNCWTSNALSIVRVVSASTLPKVDQIFGGTNASGGQFVGDYNLKKIESVEFDVRAAGLTSNPEFVFSYTKAGFTNLSWIYRSTSIPCETSSNWVHVSIPLAFSTTWINGNYYWGPAPTPVEAETIFNEDKGNVVGLKIQVYSPRNILTNEEFSITNLKLVGPWGGPFTNGISVAWLQENGLDIVNALQNKDNFGRPLDLAFFACTDPNDPNDVFRVEIGRNSEGKPVLKWKEGNRYAKYDLLEGTDLTDVNTFQKVPGFQDMQGSGTQKEVSVDAAQVTGPRFYKIQVNVQ